MGIYTGNDLAIEMKNLQQEFERQRQLCEDNQNYKESLRHYKESLRQEWIRNGSPTLSSYNKFPYD